MSPLPIQGRAKVYGGTVAAHADPLTTGEIVAIAVTIGLFFIAMVFLTVVLLRRRKNRRAAKETHRVEVMKAAQADGVRTFRPSSMQPPAT